MNSAIALPLLAATAPDVLVAFDETRGFDAEHFVRAVRALAVRMPSPSAKAAVLNMCANRYQFAIGFGAALVRGLPTLMPASHSAETLSQLRVQFPDVVLFTDGADGLAAANDLPRLDAISLTVTEARQDGDDFSVPMIDAAQLAAYVFTSGSTGLPTPHAKHFGALVSNARAEGERFGMTDAPNVAPFSVVGTVPPQHMYGFETTVLLPLMNGHAFYAGRPFFPLDVARSLAAASAPRMLVTTPVHLRAICAHPEPMADLAHVISATAPLDAALAEQAEAYFRAPLSEVYGCTEAGQVATRRTLYGETWQTYANVLIHPNSDGTATVSGGHVETPVILSDFVRVEDSTHFALLGRTADMINIAGKRVSLAYLNHHLLMIEGVKDGSFFWPDHNEAETLQRLVAFVVAPDLDRAQLRAALARIIDPAFMPRPVFWLDHLPRNSTGKLTRASLQSLFEDRKNSATDQQ
jgi:acyl-coenzyme A synthetase/AMP-(fatty) acid ligase